MLRPSAAPGQVLPLLDLRSMIEQSPTSCYGRRGPATFTFSQREPDRLEPTTTARFGGWRRGAGRVAEEGALPEPHPAGCLSAGPAALGRSLQSAPGWMWSQASESRSPRLPSISCKGSSTHLLAAFLLT